MKFFLWIFLLVLPMSAAAADVSIAGKWQVSTSIVGVDGTEVCTFTQSEATLTGTCKADDGDHALTGKMDGNKVTWQYKAEYNGDPLTLVFTGTVNSDNEFTGTVDVNPMSVSGDFTAKRAKE